MSSIVVAGDTSGTVTLQAPAVAGSSVLTLPVATDTLVGKATTDVLTNKTLGSGLVAGASLLTSGTAVASTSGTSIDFTGIPSWVKRITVMFNGVSTSGASPVRIQIGSGSVETSGYIGSTIYTSSAGGISGTNLATLGAGFDINDGGDGTVTTRQGTSILSFLGSNAWVLLSNVGVAATAGVARCVATNGSKTTSGALDRVRITTVNGTDTFDAGSINIMYE